MVMALALKPGHYQSLGTFFSYNLFLVHALGGHRDKRKTTAHALALGKDELLSKDLVPGFLWSLPGTRLWRQEDNNFLIFA